MLQISALFSNFPKLSPISPTQPPFFDQTTQPPLPRPQGASDFITMALFHFDWQLALGLGLTLPFVLSGLAGPLLQLGPGQFQFQPIFNLFPNAAFFLKKKFIYYITLAFG